jgi:predicted dehydrogenase
MEKTRIGVVGCGNISPTYLRNCARFKHLEVVACADLIRGRAEAKAKEFNIPKVCTTAELVNDPHVDVVLNLTFPKAHAEVDLLALQAGKPVHAEKPFAVTREEGREVLALARAKKLRVGSAPDTFLGAAHQTARKLLDDGWIGQPAAATAFMMSHGAEGWHPDPEIFYERGGGPLLDMGPYYLTSLVNLLGPVRRVTGAARTSFPERLITSQPKCGKRIKVEVPTHLVGVLDFVNGAVATVITTFDVWASQVPFIEIHGSEGSLSVPDPNNFNGPVKVWRGGAEAWSEIPVTHGYDKESRSLGLADMAAAIQSGRPHRANGEMAFHVLDIVCAIHEASAQGQHIELTSTCSRPAPMPMQLRDGAVEP